MGHIPAPPGLFRPDRPDHPAVPQPLAVAGRRRHHRRLGRRHRAGDTDPPLRNPGPHRRFPYLGMAILRRRSHRNGHPRRPPYRRYAGGRNRRQPPDPNLFHRLYARRPRLRPLFRLYVPLHRLHARPHPFRQHHPAIRLLGTGRAILLPPYRILARAPRRRRRRQKSLHHHPHRRRRLPDRHPIPIPQSRRFRRRRTQRLSHPRYLASRPAPGRRRRDPRRCRPNLDGPRHIRRRRRQIRPIPPPRLAPRRHGRPHPRKRPNPRRHDGSRRRFPRRPLLPRIPAIRRRPRRSSPNRRLHRPNGRHHGPRNERHQARNGLLHRQPTRLYDGRPGHGRFRPCHLPFSHPRPIQSPAIPGRRQRQPRQRHL